MKRIKLKESELVNLINRVINEQQSEDGGDVEVYHLTNKKTGETTRVNRNHEMWSRVKSIASKGTPKKLRQTTKGKLNEGKLFCCWFKGGCCDFVVSEKGNESNGLTPYIEWLIGWSACCKNSSKGACCGSFPVNP
mgnify:CR=1 FL=1